MAYMMPLSEAGIMQGISSVIHPLEIELPEKVSELLKACTI